MAASENVELVYETVVVLVDELAVRAKGINVQGSGW